MSAPRTSMRSDLARVRGLGPAHDGVGHWWAQRLTALALVPLTLWFVASIIGLVGADHATAAEWIARPIPAMLLALLIVATFHHAQLGLQVVIEDYVHVEGLKITLILAVKGLSVLLAVAALFSVFRILSWAS